MGIYVPSTLEETRERDHQEATGVFPFLDNE